MLNNTEARALLFAVFLLILLVTLVGYSLTHWDGRLGIEDNGDGRIETLYVINPLNQINPAAGDYHHD